MPDTDFQMFPLVAGVDLMANLIPFSFCSVYLTSALTRKPAPYESGFLRRQEDVKKICAAIEARGA